MKIKGLTEIRIFLCLLLLASVTAVKLLAPGHAEELRGAVLEAIGSEYDYEAAFARLGERIAQSDVFNRITGEAGEDAAVLAAPTGEFDPVTLNELRGIEEPTLPELIETAKTEAEAVSEPPAVVAAFLESQAEFANETVPAEVSYEMPSLPFEYGSPVEAETSSGFGYRLHPVRNEVVYHYGTDFAVWSGTAVRAFADGTVSMVGWDAGYGNYIIVDHPDGWNTLYAHCGTVYVTCGESVGLGETIALSGDTGDVTGPHLHFELRCSGTYYNPEFWLA